MNYFPTKYPYNQFYSNAKKSTRDDGCQCKENTLTVYGEGVISTKPDLAIVRLGVVTQGNEASETQLENSKLANQLLNSLYDLGIPKEDIETLQYNIIPIYDYSESTKKLVGYKVTHIFKIVVDDISKVGTVIDTSTKNGANTVLGVDFSIKYPNVFYRNALQKAIINATKKAKKMSNCMNVELNMTPLSICEERYSTYPSYDSLKVYATNGVPTPIQEGTIDIKAFVTMIYEYTK
ncbi:SIMPL domain-containing protein [Romboutsia sp.]|uniref:SIMPL domain-containing protein n=1 Tax=Romboutsia sp. TaxID=1965302 RepID=UPI002B807D24|nr:SIMPL domain-containing protein [Romboutsia sp.]HSQ87273.1 SIMPL domain-containing protein [Romboutsia sp.]